MQWLAIFAALGWTVLQFFVFMLSLNCGLGFIGYDPVKKRWMLVFYIVFVLMLASYVSLIILPFVSTGLFWYYSINIAAWGDLKPALWCFAIWWGVLFLFCALLAASERMREQQGWSRRQKENEENEKDERSEEDKQREDADTSSH